MEKIYIPHLKKAHNHCQVIIIDDVLPDLETLTPIRGEIKVTHQGNYLQVDGKAETIITLTCDRCLKQFNHKLKLKTSEMIWLDDQGDGNDSLGLEREVPGDDLIETLHPQGHFEPDSWLYEQLCLSIPNKKICGDDCQGIKIQEQSSNVIDQRWAVLASLKEQIKHE